MPDGPGNPPPARHGTLEVICGPMFAGKTTALLARIAAVRAAGRRALVLKPARDTRYDPGALATHDGRREPAVPVRALAEVLAGPGDAVFVDEVHFFGSDAVPPIEALLADGADVTVAGCDIDHFGGAFAPFDALLPRASVVTRIAGTCARCGAPSTHSERLLATRERVVVGGIGDFVATCAACFRPMAR
jgi:thymidine kinase